MRAALQWIWRLPWPGRLRKLTPLIITAPVLRLLVFPHFTVGVVGVIENERGEVLLLRHTYRGDYPWGLPTGVMEYGEQPVDALRREVSEETGFEVELSPHATLFTELNRPLLNIIFRGRYLAGSFSSSTEISSAQFFPLDALPPVLPGQAEIIQQWAKERRQA